jgi:hypothetical protein
MAPPHGFGFLLYRPQPQPAAAAAGGGGDVPVPPPIQLYNAGIDSKHARRRLPELSPVQQRVLGSGGTTQGVCVCVCVPAFFCCRACVVCPVLVATCAAALLLLPRTEAGAVFLRKIRDLSPPEQEGQRPLCVDMRVQVRCVGSPPCSCNSWREASTPVHHPPTHRCTKTFALFGCCYRMRHTHTNRCSPLTSATQSRAS